MPITDNMDEIAAWLKAVVEQINMEMPGVEQSLGRDLAGVVADGIHNRTVEQKLDGAGNPLPANEAKYAARKAKDYNLGANEPALRTGQMTSLESLLGQTVVSGNAVEMQYGTGEPPKSTRSGGWARPALQAADQKVTDVEKAAWYTEKFADFYALDERIAGECVEVCEEVIKNHEFKV
jgi:hypothetical protein